MIYNLKLDKLYKPFKFKCIYTYTYQEILLTKFLCTFLVVSLYLLQSLNPNIDIVFLLLNNIIKKKLVERAKVGHGSL